MQVHVVDAAARDTPGVLEPAAHRLGVEAVAGDIADCEIAAHRSEIERVRLDASRADVAADAARRQVAVVLNAAEGHVAGHALRRFDLRCIARRHVAADRLAAHRATDAGHLDAAGHRLDLNRRAVRNRHGEIDGYVVVATKPAAFVLGSDIDTSRTIVDDDPDVRKLTLVAARPLDRFNRDFVAGAAGHGDVAGDVADADAAVATELHLAREPVALLRTAIAPLVSTHPLGAPHLSQDQVMPRVLRARRRRAG